ncbi:D-glycerate 2-kinase [hydrothermal vent metagenome]|uniref:D-glycerate 2-kinase n=1 Tax=hydrothermal vent metagenome TaxID=652676 RepID=A0A3B0T3L2_9ZZZZ
MNTKTRAFLKALFEAGIAAADPALVVPPALPPRPRGRVVVVGAGKASAAMAQALEEAWDGPLEGLVVTRTGYGAPCRRIEIVEAAHPVPDTAGLAGAARMLKLVEGLGRDDLVIALISGGGSSLLCLPPAQVGLKVKQQVNAILLASGAPIAEMNAVRKHLSCIKGGRLAAAAAPAKVVSLVISDIPGDDAALVASGPTIADDTGREVALEIVRRYAMDLPKPAMDWLANPAAAAPSPSDPVFDRHEVHLIAAAQMSLEAAAAGARADGLSAHILSDAMEGEARDAGGSHAAIARQMVTRGQPFTAPAVLLSGGETTVTLSAAGRQEGRGGRNTEFLLGFALGIDGLAGISALAADTDGIDGSEDNAGAFADGGSITRLRQLGHDPKAMLARNDAWGAFDVLGDLLITGPTRTNVNDFRAILVDPGTR